MRAHLARSMEVNSSGRLSGRKYSLTEASKIKIESKKEVKKRGQPSPDEADCVLLLCLPVKPPKRKEVKKNG